MTGLLFDDGVTPHIVAIIAAILDDAGKPTGAFTVRVEDDASITPIPPLVTTERLPSRWLAKRLLARFLPPDFVLVARHIGGATICATLGAWAFGDSSSNITALRRRT